jgi:GNAT superfamily N-acetyltransferase
MLFLKKQRFTIKIKRSQTMRLSILSPSDAFGYIPLTFSMDRGYLLHCDRENIAAVGASDGEGGPCGLILALAVYGPDGKMSDTWYLASVFVTEAARRRGIGRGLWNELKKELKARGCKHLRCQTVLKEERLAELIPYVVAMGFDEPRRIAQIFAFDDSTIEKSPFIRGTLADAFRPDSRFRYIPFDSLSLEQQTELETNEGGWYPAFVSPLIGKEHMNQKCTTFAVDSDNGKIAGWITALDVNNNTRILYRSFFTREEYRDTPVGFFVFTEAVRNHLQYYRDRGGLSSIPTDNERAMRFSTLFFRGAYDHISYEIVSHYDFY